MPYTMKVDGMAEISERLTQMAEKAPAIAAQALYEGAGVMADEVKASVQGIRTAPFKWASSRRSATRLPSPEEKAIVEEAAAGIAKFRKDGTEVDTSVGFRNAGYAMLKGKRVPIPKIVNAINSGTSFMQKQPFIRQAARRGAPAAMAAMKAKVEEAFEELNKEK